MIRKVVVAIAALAVAAVLAPDAASAQETKAAGFVVDGAKAKVGQKVFASKACSACHTIGKGRSAGPDLVDVVDKREHAWLMQWLQNTTKMLETDPIAKQLLAEYKGMKMPDLKLTEAESDGVIHYIAQEAAKKKK